MRRCSGLTQAQVAEKVGVPNTHVSGIETGERGASYPTILAVLRVNGSTLKEAGGRDRTRQWLIALTETTMYIPDDLNPLPTSRATTSHAKTSSDAPAT
jgi:transcriptional regulator with XRE-family HTH domain